MEKEHILREIKRTAEENGGKPLGLIRFESETGIKPHQWGKHWTGWGDALLEAGFAPNDWNRAYDDTGLLEKYAQLAHELGRLPVRNDLRMKAHRNSDFPSITPFQRLGEKAEIVRRLREYCLIHEGYNDVVAMCDAYTAPARTIPTASGDGDSQIEYVYLMKSGQFYKIGHSGAPGRRQYDLSIQLPEKVVHIHEIPTPAPEAAERYWHERFKAKRKGGEWFALNAADVKAFKRCKSM